MGQAKLEKYGNDFLNAITEYRVANGEQPTTLTPDLTQTMHLVQQGLDLDSIATARGQTLTDTAEELIQLIDAGQPVYPERLIARKKVDLIEDVLQDFGAQAD